MKRYSHQHIKALLDKFMDGQTTLEEEALLGDYFRTHDVPAEWEDYRVMFGYFDGGMRQPVTHHRTQRGWWWWTGVAAAAVGALVVGLTVANRQPATTRPKSAESPAIAAIDTTAAIDKMAGVETRELASLQAKPVVTVETPHLASRANHKRSQAARHRRLEAENKRLAKENERLQRELEDLKRRAFIIDMEAMGYKAVQDENGNIVFIDLNQEIENEFNNQPTNNIPAL